MKTRLVVSLIALQPVPYIPYHASEGSTSVGCFRRLVHAPTTASSYAHIDRSKIMNEKLEMGGSCESSRSDSDLGGCA